MQTARIIGNNCKFLLNKNSISKETFASSLGYSAGDVEKLCDGRLYTTDQDLKEIADYFHVSTEELCTDGKEKQRYIGKGFVHCMNSFQKSENEEKILDIFDMYCDLKELLNK